MLPTADVAGCLDAPGEAMASAPLPELLGVEAVMRRYGIRDRRVARRVMDEAGAFLIGRRLVVRVDDLDTYERGLQQARSGVGARDAAGLAAKRVTRGVRQEVRPGWWRDGGGGTA